MLKNKKIALQATAVGAAACLTSGAAMAQAGSNAGGMPLKMQTNLIGWGASVGARTGYSDNNILQAEGAERDEIILGTDLSASAIASSKRFTGILIADLNLSQLIETGDFNVNQDASAAGTAVIAENWFYIDAGARTSRNLIGENARFGGSANSGRDQRADVHTLAISPVLYHEMPDRSTVGARFRVSKVFVGDNPAGGVNAVNNSFAKEAYAEYGSGTKFSRFRINLSGYANETEEDGVGELPGYAFRQISGTGAIQYVIGSGFSLTGAGGYDEVETEDATALFFSDEELSGGFWRAGFSWRPNRRANARIEYGERYGGEFINANISYRLTNRISFNASADRSLQTRTQAAVGGNRQLQNEILNFADALREGGEDSPRGIVQQAGEFARTNRQSSRDILGAGVGVVNTASAGLSTQRGRTSFFLRGAYRDSDFGLQQTESFDAFFQVAHPLSRRLNADFSVSFTDSTTVVDGDVCLLNPLIFGLESLSPDFDLVSECDALVASNGNQKTVVSRVGGNYKLYENVNVFAEFSHADRFADNPFNEYTENRFSMGLSLGF